MNELLKQLGGCGTLNQPKLNRNKHNKYLKAYLNYEFINGICLSLLKLKNKITAVSPNEGIQNQIPNIPDNVCKPQLLKSPLLDHTDTSN